jgi:hypothetical protein
MNGPEAINSTNDFREAHMFSLKSELISPKIKIKSTHSTSLGAFVLTHKGARPRLIIVGGNRQANNMEVCLTRGGQLWIAVTEKIKIKKVQNRKTIKAQLSQRAIVLEVNSVSFKDIIINVVRVHRCQIDWLGALFKAYIISVCRRFSSLRLCRESRSDSIFSTSGHSQKLS